MTVSITYWARVAIQRLLFLVAASVSLIGTSLAEQGDFFCDTCNKSVVLHKEDRACLKNKVDQYIDETKRTNPVLIVLFGCDDTSKSLEDNTKLSRDTIIEVTGTPGAGADEPSVFVLTRRQLTCLKKSLPDLVADPRNPVTFDFTACAIENAP